MKRVERAVHVELLRREIELSEEPYVLGISLASVTREFAGDVTMGQAIVWGQ